MTQRTTRNFKEYIKDKVDTYLNLDKKGKDLYSKNVEIMNKSNLDKYKTQKKDRNEWNQILNSEFMTSNCTFINNQCGITGNQYGLISIKLTDNNYDDLHDPIKKMILYHGKYINNKTNRTDETGSRNNNNRGLKKSYETQQKYLIFKGKNSSLELIGLGITTDFSISIKTGLPNISIKYI